MSERDLKLEELDRKLAEAEAARSRYLASKVRFSREPLQLSGVMVDGGDCCGSDVYREAPIRGDV